MYFIAHKARKAGLPTTSQGQVSNYSLSQNPGQVKNGNCVQLPCLNLGVHLNNRRSSAFIGGSNSVT